MELSILERDEILSHFPAEVSSKIVDYANDVALKDSRYLFIRRSGSGQQYGYCTHCRKQSKTDDLKHNGFSICPACSLYCQVKSHGRGRKYLRDDAYFVWYEKSISNPKSITARGIHVKRDYSESYHDVETKFRVTALYLFEPGQSRMIENYYWNETYWKKRSSIISESNTSFQNYRCFCSHASIKEAVKGTPFQYSTWEEYTTSYPVNDMLKFFDLAAKYPCIEYLTKLGMDRLVWDKLLGRKTFNAINWRGKTINKVLKLSKQELKEIRKYGHSVTPYSLFLLQQSKKDGSNFSITEALELSRLIDDYYSEHLKKVNKLTSMRKIFNYIKKQYYSKDAGKHYRVEYQVLTTWGDYIADCLKLGQDLKDDSILFPTNLYDAHQKTIEKVKVQEDKSLNELIAKRVKSLNKYCFNKDGFYIRPAASSIELLKEGKHLKHCVGTYAEKYAKGKTDLFLVRKLSDPETPFYTIEISNRRIVQARGLKNCLPTEDVQSFIDTFEAEKLNKISPRKTLLVERREVAV
ncbi:PcfJ domain-containing protein [Bacillus sp. ISL-45]|uniref:PcfJ domain-containing protein n=1 Tax=Bacillus sp. ISL-45 TaxID=2819128 RepID=UPI001BED3716|nr:PcfJ domain-containing protein [Bacillus sp. ISL-45]